MGNNLCKPAICDKYAQNLKTDKKKIKEFNQKIKKEKDFKKKDILIEKKISLQNKININNTLRKYIFLKDNIFYLKKKFDIEKKEYYFIKFLKHDFEYNNFSLNFKSILLKIKFKKEIEKKSIFIPNLISFIKSILKSYNYNIIIVNEKINSDGCLSLIISPNETLYNIYDKYHETLSLDKIPKTLFESRKNIVPVKNIILDLSNRISKDTEGQKYIEYFISFVLAVYPKEEKKLTYFTKDQENIPEINKYFFNLKDFCKIMTKNIEEKENNFCYFLFWKTENNLIVRCIISHLFKKLVFP